jgi:hypothetical protein
MLVNILSIKVKERAIILTVKSVGFLARMGYKKIPYQETGYGILHAVINELML